MRRLLMLCADRPWWVLSLLLAFSLLAATQLDRIQVRISTEELLLIDDPERAYYEEISRQFGDEEVVLLFLRDPELMAPARLAALQQAIARLEQLPFVDRVESLFSLPHVRSEEGYLKKDPYLKALPADKQQGTAILRQALADPFARYTLLSGDGEVMSAAIVLREDLSGIDDVALTTAVDQAIEPLRGAYQEAFAIGHPYVRTAIARQIQEEQVRLLPYALGALLIALFLLLRHIVDILMPVLTGALSILWTLGLMGVTGIPLNVVTSMVPVLLVIVGSTEDIHLLAEFRRAQAKGRGTRVSLQAMAERMGRIVLLTFVTTYIGFFSVGISGIEALWQFGVLASTGLLFNFLVTVSLIPALLALVGRWRLERSIRERRRQKGRLVAAYWGLLHRYRWWILVSLLAATLVALLGIPRIEVNHSAIESLAKDSLVRQQVEEVNRELAGLDSFSIILESGIQDTFLKVRYLEQIAAIQDFIAQQGLSRSTTAFTDYLAMLNMAFQELNQPSLPASDDVVDELMVFLDYRHVQAYVSPDYSRARILVRHAVDSTGEMQVFLDDIQGFIDANLDPGLRARITGSSVLTLSATDSMLRGQLESIALLLGVFILIISVLFTDVRVGLLAALPNAFPVIVMFGVMGYADIPLNIGTTMAAAIAIGIAVDDTLHFMLRYNRELKSSRHQVAAMHATLAAEGLPVLATSVALVAGFLVFTLSDFQPVFLFGVLSALVIATALLADFVITPLAMSSLRLVNLWDLLSAQLRRELIPNSALFRGMRPWQIRRFILAADLVDYRRDQIIFEPGDEGSRMYLVMEGSVEVLLPAKPETEEPVVVGRFGAGDLFGDVAVLAGELRRTRAVAVEASVLLELSRENLYNVVQHHPLVGSRIFYNLAIDVSCRWIRFISRIESGDKSAEQPDARLKHTETSQCVRKP